MPKATIGDYLMRAREVAMLADKNSGPEKKRLLDLAEAWLKMADSAAVEALKSAGIKAEPLENNPKPN